MGGLSKKSSLLKSLATPAESLKIDAGTLFFDDKVANQPQRLPHTIITAAAMVEAYNQMGFDAIAIGAQDLSAGLDTLQILADKASFPFLSANLVDHKGALLFQPTIEIERSGMRIGLIGLTGQTNLPETCLDKVKILTWQEVLPKTVAKISLKSDLVIILSNLSPAENREIARQMPDVHLILQSGVSKQNMRPQLINNTLITQVGHDGKYQGQLTIHWSPAKKWQQGERPLLALRKEYDRLGWLINRVGKKGGPEIVYKDNGAAHVAYQKKLARYQELEAEIKEMARGKNKNAPPPATYSNRFHPLPPSLADDVVIVKLLQEARKKANQDRRQTAETKKLHQYMGSSTCRNCHETIYLAWSKTPHASAYQTLKKRDQNNNLTCVYCHVTGLNEATAYLASSLPDSLKAVGCEVCHGPGKNHAADPSLSPPPRKPDPRLCSNCHSAERDDNFDFQHDKGKVH